MDRDKKKHGTDRNDYNGAAILMVELGSGCELYTVAAFETPPRKQE